MRKQLCQTIAVKSRLIQFDRKSAFHCNALHLRKLRFGCYRSLSHCLLRFQKLPPATFRSAFLRLVHYSLSATNAFCCKTWHAFSPLLLNPAHVEGAHIFSQKSQSYAARLWFSLFAGFTQASFR